MVWLLRKFELSLSSAPCRVQTNFIVRLEWQGRVGEGEVALNLGYADTEESVREAFDHFTSKSTIKIGNIAKLTEMIEDIKMPNCLRFGIESAYIHYLAAVSGKSVQEILSLNRVKFRPTSFSLPRLEIGDLKEVYRGGRLDRFGSLKITVDEDNAEDLIREAVKLYKGKLRIDADESFRDPRTLINILEKFKDISVEFLEQPMPAGMYEELKELKNSIDIPIIADQSLVSGYVTRELGEQFDGINIKLMKSGGYIKALNQIKAARELGMQVLLSSTVETGLGVYSAMNIADKADYFDLSNFLFVENDPYNLVTEENGNIFYSSVH